MKNRTEKAGTRPVPATVKAVRRGRLVAATSLAPVEETGVSAGNFHLKMRPKLSKNWAVFNGGTYVVSTKTADFQKAKDFLEVYEAQAEAKKEGEADVRFADATEVIDGFVRAKGRSRESQDSLRNALDRLRPFVAGKKVRLLDDDWVDRTWEALKKAQHKEIKFAKGPPGCGYADASIWLSFAQLSVAILKWCGRHGAMRHLPFKRPAAVKGRDIVFDSREQQVIQRWSRGTEEYDPKTRKWTPASQPLNERQVHERRMIDRMFTISLATASRPGNVWGLATQESVDCPYILLEERTLYRLPVGVTAPNNKKAPSVVLSPATMAAVRRYVTEDGPDELYILRTWERTGIPARPLSQAACSTRWKKAMLRLGIKGRRHTCRHTTVTNLVHRNVPAIVISATAGMSLRTLDDKYNHTAGRDVQPIAFAAIDALLAKGAGADVPKRPH